MAGSLWIHLLKRITILSLSSWWCCGWTVWVAPRSKWSGYSSSDQISERQCSEAPSLHWHTRNRSTRFRWLVRRTLTMPSRWAQTALCARGVLICWAPHGSTFVSVKVPPPQGASSISIPPVWHSSLAIRTTLSSAQRVAASTPINVTQGAFPLYSLD